MKERQLAFLDYIVRYYIKNAQPAGSKLLAEKTAYGVSSATIRNDLFLLEKQGYLCQPYTSAGRVPTEKGYKFWLQNFFQPKKIKPLYQQKLQDIRKKHRQRPDFLKEAAKAIAEFSQLAVIVGVSSRYIYYTGISYLFSQPEFKNYQSVCTISEVVDALDEDMPRLFSRLENNVTMLVGSDNPFSRFCSLVSARLGKESLISILGPLRMDYEQNFSLLSFLKELENKK